MSFIVRRGDDFLRLEGVFEYPRWMVDANHATLLPRSKAATYAGIFGGEVVAVQQ